MNKNEIKSKLTREKLCNAYIELYKQKNIENITIKNITDKAGYNRGTFYIHFKDVYDIHEKVKKDLILEAKNNIEKNIKNDKNVSFENIFNNIVPYYIKKQNILIPFITKDSSFASSIKEILKPMISETLNKDTNNKYMDYLIEYHLSSIFSVINFWLINKKDISIDELFDLLAQVITKGVFNVIKDL